MILCVLVLLVTVRRVLKSSTVTANLFSLLFCQFSYTRFDERCSVIGGILDRIFTSFNEVIEARQRE